MRRALGAATNPSCDKAIVDQRDVASQRKARKHAFTGRTQLVMVLDRIKPKLLFQTGHRSGTASVAVAGHFQFRRLAAGFGMVRSLLDRYVIACFRAQLQESWT
jgi:hypothetical protein